MKKVLLTGFMPFGGEKINPSYEAIKQLTLDLQDVQLLKLEVPTTYNESINYVIKQVEEFNPDIILMTGQAGGRKEISVERVSINIDDSILPDNNHITHVDQPIILAGDPAFFSTLPIKKIVQKISDSGLPAGISNSAGTYVCNHLMYGVLHYLKNQNKNNIKTGFIHVPYVKEQVLDKKDVFALGLNEITEALTIAIKTILED